MVSEYLDFFDTWFLDYILLTLEGILQNYTLVQERGCKLKFSLLTVKQLKPTTIHYTIWYHIKTISLMQGYIKPKYKTTQKVPFLKYFFHFLYFATEWWVCVRGQKDLILVHISRFVQLHLVTYLVALVVVLHLQLVQGDIWMESGSWWPRFPRSACDQMLDDLWPWCWLVGCRVPLLADPTNRWK